MIAGPEQLCEGFMPVQDMTEGTKSELLGRCLRLFWHQQTVEDRATLMYIKQINPRSAWPDVKHCKGYLEAQETNILFFIMPLFVLWASPAIDTVKS